MRSKRSASDSGLVIISQYETSGYDHIPCTRQCAFSDQKFAMQQVLILALRLQRTLTPKDQRLIMKRGRSNSRSVM